jgi:hypothetical protein
MPGAIGSIKHGDAIEKRRQIMAAWAVHCTPEW